MRSSSREALEPRVAGLGDRPPGAEVVEGVDEAAALVVQLGSPPPQRVATSGPAVGSAGLAARAARRRVRGARRAPPRAASSRARRPSATRSRGPIRQRGPVSSRASDAPADGSCTTRSVATTSCTSGTVSRPPSPTTSTGMPRASSAAAQPAGTATACGPAPRCRRAGAPRRAAVPGPRARRPGRASVGCRSSAAEPGRPAARPRPRRSRSSAHSMRPRSLRPRAGPQPRHVLGLLAQLALDTGGGVEDPLAVAEARGQLAHRRGPGRPRGSRGRTPEVAGAGAAPAVDRLARVADRGHRVAAAEQRLEQHELRVAGVLVLVEQHDAVPRALDHADLGVLGGDPRGERELVAVVEHLTLGLGPLVGLDERQELLAYRAGRRAPCPGASWSAS